MARITDGALASMLLAAAGCGGATTPPSTTDTGSTDTGSFTSSAASTGDTGLPAALPDEDWELLGDRTWEHATAVGGVAAGDLDADGVAELLVEVVSTRVNAGDPVYTEGYATLWNAFKRMAAGASASEKTALFSGTAKRVYKLS